MSKDEGKTLEINQPVLQVPQADEDPIGHD